MAGQSSDFSVGNRNGPMALVRKKKSKAVVPADGADHTAVLAKMENLAVMDATNPKGACVTALCFDWATGSLVPFCARTSYAPDAPSVPVVTGLPALLARAPVQVN